MTADNLLLNLHNLGIKLVQFFNWLFEYLNEPIAILGNISILDIAFSSAITFFLIKGIVDALLGGLAPGE